MKTSYGYVSYFFTLKVAFGIDLKSQFFLVSSLFLLLFMSSITLFSTIHGSHCAILATFTFIYSTFRKKIPVSTK